VLRIRAVYPESRIQKQQQKRGVKTNLLSYLFCSHEFHKIENYFIFEMLKKIWASFQRIIKLLTQKFVTNLSKKWVWDPGSEIRHPRSGKKNYSGSRIRVQESKRHRIPGPNPQHCKWANLFLVVENKKTVQCCGSGSRFGSRSASLCRIRIRVGIQGMTIRIRQIRLVSIPSTCKFLLFSRKFQYAVQKYLIS
jgi:hypothetical protein